MSAQVRQIYYQCTNVECAMSWSALLSFDRVISPSGLSSGFRQIDAHDAAMPPGHEFGQECIDSG